MQGLKLQARAGTSLNNMWADIFVNPCFDGCLANGFLQYTLVLVMAFHSPIVRIRGKLAGRKDKLPGLLFRSIGILLRQGNGK
jgi:hypothetical protein